MALATIYTRALTGLQTPLVAVEVHMSSGLPGFTLVGLAEKSVKEARDRVRSALLSSGFTFPAKRITVNLAPADLPKTGGRFDLAIAIGILAASHQIPFNQLSCYEFLGELSLSGQLRVVTGSIPAALAARNAQRKLILAVDNGSEVALIGGTLPLLAPDLVTVAAYLHGKASLTSAQPTAMLIQTPPIDIQEVIGQQQAKRALEIAAAGGHHLLLFGPPGTGKTMLAHRLIGLLPPLTLQEALESAAITSLLPNYQHAATWLQRPFRAPHHSASLAALVGGGPYPIPGEISLAHHGVLFLDELPEFERRVLDALRQPLERGEITISRAHQKATFPARFQLIAAMNPTPNGHYRGRYHRSTLQQTLRYLNRLSGPFIDRFDLSIEVTNLPPGTLHNELPTGESSSIIKARVETVRKRQNCRIEKLNAQLTPYEIKQVCCLSPAEGQFLEQALHKLGLSIRAWHKILKVARTIADLAASENITRAHLIESLSYRAIERLLRRLLP